MEKAVLVLCAPPRTMHLALSSARQLCHMMAHLPGFALLFFFRMQLYVTDMRPSSGDISSLVVWVTNTYSSCRLANIE